MAHYAVHAQRIASGCGRGSRLENKSVGRGVRDARIPTVEDAVLPAIAVALLVGTQIPAQDSTACAFDIATHTVRASVTVGFIAPWRKGQRIETRQDYLSAAQAIQSFYERPAQVRLPLWARTVGPYASHSHLSGLRGQVQFRLDDVGRLADSQIVVQMASPDVAESIVAAIRRADSAGAFMPPSSAVRSEHGLIRLRLVPLPDSSRPAIPLLQLVVPAVVVDSEPALLAFPPLTYPMTLREEGLGDRVMMQFVVLPDGRIDPSSLDLVSGTYREFAVEAIEGLQAARFRPARIGRCPVPIMAAMPIDFKIRRD